MTEAQPLTEHEAVQLDTAARLQALDPGRSILLQAPAGSGKTSVLTQRFLRLLCTVEEPEQILAITFTRKAAGEMRERIFRALRGEIDATSAEAAQLTALADAARAHAHARGWSLETHPGRLRIQTIDSLNRWLAARLPLAARSAGDLTISEQPQSLYRNAARNALHDAESEPALRADLELLYERLDNDFGRFERLLIEMLQARSRWLPHLLGAAPGQDVAAELRQRVEASLREIVADRLAHGVRLLPRPVLEEGASLARHAALNRRARGDTPRAPWQAWLAESSSRWPYDLPRWQGLVHLALTDHGTWRTSVSVKQGFPPEEPAVKARAQQWLGALARIEGVRELFGEIALLPPLELAGEDAAALGALARVLTLAAGELQLTFEQHGRVDYPHVAAAARRALMQEGAPTDLGLRLGEQIRHVLVDEFQDTSLEQCGLLEALTAGWSEGDGRTLFVVGDPMQSIYQFREAEVGLFLRTRTCGLGALRLEPLTLRRNFRAVPALIAWTNRIFPACFPPLDDPRTSAVRYTPCIPGRKPQPGGGVHLHRTSPGDARGEATAIARLVRTLRAGEPGASVAILLSARAHAAPIVAALAEAGIPVAGVDLVPLAELSVVRDLTALARALDHLADRTAWLGVLRAPWCGLTLSELAQLTEGAAERTVWESVQDEGALARLPPAARARLSRTRAALAAALAERDRPSSSRWVESTWLSLGGPAACASDADLHHAQAFLRALARWAAEPHWTGPLALGELLDQLYAAQFASPADAVQIMTIHHAKGLEFDKVILPGLGRRARADAEPLLRWLSLPRDPRGADLLLAPIPSPERRGREPLNTYLKSLQRRRGAHERARLMYVAATRARSELHLFGELPHAADARREAAPQSGTLLATLWRALAPEFPAEVASEAPRAPAVPTSVPLQRLTADWCLPELPPGPVTAALAIASYAAPAEDTEQELTLDPERCAARVVRDLLRRAARSGRPPSPWSEPLERAVRERLARIGVPGAAGDPAALQAARLFEACRADPRLRWMFSPAHHEVAGPLALTGLYEGRLASVAADLSFVDADGVRWLIDFKAGAPGEEDTPAFLAREMARHEGELAQYLSLGRRLGAARIRVAAYFTAVQSLCEHRGPGDFTLVPAAPI